MPFKLNSNQFPWSTSFEYVMPNSERSNDFQIIYIYIAAAMFKINMKKVMPMDLYPNGISSLLRGLNPEI